MGGWSVSIDQNTIKTTTSKTKTTRIQTVTNPNRDRIKASQELRKLPYTS